MSTRPDLDSFEKQLPDRAVTTGFATHWELTQLPWFATDMHGRLVLSPKPDWWPVIDVHTHLALAFLIQKKINLRADTGQTFHFLPLDRPINLEGYQNVNYTGSDLKRMKRQYIWGGKMRRSHSAPNLIRDMTDMGIAISLLHPIDWRKGLSQNANAYLGVAPEYPEILSFGSVNPKGFLGTRRKRRRKAARRYEAMRLEAQRQKEAGALGIKLHPAQQKVAPNDWRAMLLAQVCTELDLPLFYHCGPVDIESAPERKLCQLPNYEAPVKEYPECTFVFGHAGALQMNQALDLALRYENVWLDLSSQGLSSIREILSHPGLHDRTMFGSDWPFYHQAPMLAKVLIATRGEPKLRRIVLRDNAARLLKVEVKHLRQAARP